VLTDLHDHRGDGGVKHPEQGEDDHVGDDHEEEVAGDDGAVESGLGRGACEVGGSAMWMYPDPKS
jgi:hypothetical protein